MEDEKSIEHETQNTPVESTTEQQDTVNSKSEDRILPPIPERPNVDSISNVYNLGYDDLTFNSTTLEYADQSYIQSSIESNPPPVPAPQPPMDELNRAVPDIPEQYRTSSFSPIKVDKADSPLDSDTIDEMLELKPKDNGTRKNSFMKKLESSVTKMKDQTSSKINNLFHRSSSTNEDLLGINKVNQEETSPIQGDIFFDSSMDFVHTNSMESASNNDVDELFGLVSLEQEECEEEGSDEEDHVITKRKASFKNVDNRLPIFIQILAMSKQITAEEKQLIEEEATINKNEVERILHCYIESGIAVEFNQLIKRSSIDLPSKETHVKVIKDAKGKRLEINHIKMITMLVPKVFIYNNNFFFLMEMRESKFSFINKWVPCIVQLTRYQLLIYRNLSDISQENAFHRINLHSLMKVCPMMKKTYKNCMYYYTKIFEIDLGNHRVLEDKPVKFRCDLPMAQILKVGSKEDIIVRSFIYQLELRLKHIQSQPAVAY